MARVNVLVISGSMGSGKTTASKTTVAR